MIIWDYEQTIYQAKSPDVLTINLTLTIWNYLSYHNILKVFLIGCFSFSLVFNSSFGATEAVDLFNEVNSIDLILNDIWMEPKNPIEGEAVSIHGSVYNAGIVPTKTSDVVTVGYIVNGELVEINILENMLTGVENGVEISSGPIFDAIAGNYIVTVIINYHDTLSHLRDNPENNIVQKRFQIKNDVPLLINYDIYQHYNELTETQQISIQGELTNIFQKKLENYDIVFNIGDLRKNATTDINGRFSLEMDIAFENKPVKVTSYLEENQFFPTFFKNIFPLKLEKEQSALVLEIIRDTRSDNFENPTITIVLFQDSYDNLFKKISTDNLDQQSTMIDNYFSTVLPANHEYIAEIYLEGRLFDAFQSNFTNNVVVKKEIFISESAQIKFRIVNETDEPQGNVAVDNWVYSAISDKDGFTNWITVIPTITANEPYVAKATFPDGEVTWSEPFLIESGERKVIQIIQGVGKK